MALQSPVLCAATGTLASGVFTPGATIAGYRTFEDVLSASDTVDVTLRDAADAQAFYPGSTWNGSVLTLGSETAPSATIADGAATVWAVGSTPAGRALATAISASAQRTALGLGDSATLDVGTTSGTVAAGDDPRITGAAKSADLAAIATSGSYADLGSTPTTLAGYGITDAATSAQGTLANSALQPGSVDTLSKLNALVGDATLIDTGDSRLSDSRTPTAHAASHASGGDDAITPASIGAEPAGVSAADITDSTAIGRDVLTAATKLAARTAIGEPYLPAPAVQLGGTDQVISATAGTAYPIVSPWSTTTSTDSSGSITWNASGYFDVNNDCTLMFSVFARSITGSAAQSSIKIRDKGGAWETKVTPVQNITYADHVSLGFVKDVLSGQRIEVALHCGTTTTYTVSSYTSVTSLSVQVLSINE